MNKIILIIFSLLFSCSYSEEQKHLDEQKKILDSVNKEIFNLKKQIQYDRDLIKKIHSEQSDTTNLN